MTDKFLPSSQVIAPPLSLTSCFYRRDTDLKDADDRTNLAIAPLP